MGTDRLARLRARVGARIRARLGITRLERRLEALEHDHSSSIGRAWELLDEHRERLARGELRLRIATVMAWIEQATLSTEPLVSVVIASRRRAEVLPRAIDSVLAQSYANWELLVCDDGGDAETAAVVDGLGEARVRYLPGEHLGAGGARNRGLDSAAGALIAYLDDDNRMHPNWLKSVVWAFEQRPATELLYGAIVIDDTARHHRQPGAELPSVWLEPYDRARILSANVADTSAIAHRAGLADVRWDERLTTMGDWDLILRATAGRDPLALPAIACFYHSDSPARLTDLDRQAGLDRERILTRARAARADG